MSIIIPQRKLHRGQLWPLWLFGAVLLAGCLALWHYWPLILLHSAQWQRGINLELSQLLKAVAANPGAAGGALLIFSFVYGVLHALGPGHGKVVITTWLATHPSRLKTSLRLTLAASLLQGLVAILLVTIVLGVLALPVRQLHMSSFWLERGSYLLVGALGLMLSWRAGRKIWRLVRQPRFSRFTPLQAGHVHDEHCGCGHQHMPTNSQLEAGQDWRAKVMLVLSIGMRPCSGAIMVLLFSKVIGVYRWGMLSALAMAAGTALTISGFALLVHCFRYLAQRLGAASSRVLWRQLGLATLGLAGGVILVVAAVIMWGGALAPVRGLRPFQL